MNDRNLIFLISLSRSGSTLLQHLILQSKQVSSSSEPWILLQLMCTYKNFKLNQSYSPQFGTLALKNFLDSDLKNFINDLKGLALKYYAKKLEGKRYFLDKTPRYYYIIDELNRWFPQSKKIVLFRNPAAIFASYLAYFFGYDLKALFSDRPYIDDLFTGIRRLAYIKNKFGQNGSFCFVRFEDLVTRPKQEMQRIFDFLDINDVPPGESDKYQIRYSDKTVFIGDRRRLVKHSRVEPQYANLWTLDIRNAQIKRIISEYVRKLGKDIFDTLGYDYQLTLEKITSVKTKPSLFTKTLDHYLNKYYKCVKA